MSHHFKMEQYIPYLLICDLFIRNLETYLQNIPRKKHSMRKNFILINIVYEGENI